MLRTPFNSEAPFIVSSEELVCAGRRFARGEAFPWPELDVTESDLAIMWNANQVDCVQGDAAIDLLARETDKLGLYDDPAATEPARVTLTLTPGETVHVPRAAEPPPAPKHRGKRG